MKKLLIILFAATILFSSCKNWSLDAENLLSAPKLTSEQQLVYTALEESVGKNIVLKYPRAGANRSAFVLFDLDNDNEQEAIVFYSLPLKQNVVRINILNKTGKVWKSLYDIEGQGQQISIVDFAKFTTSEMREIVVGYVDPVTSKKFFVLYGIVDKALKPLYSASFNELVVCDLDNDLLDGIFFISSSQITQAHSNTVVNVNEGYLLKIVDGKYAISSTVKIDDSAFAYYPLKMGPIKSAGNAVFIDYKKGENNFATEVIGYEDKKLINYTANPVESEPNVTLLTKTYRNSQIESDDINGDNMIEIPTITPLIGYNDLPTQDVIWLTNWGRFEKKGITISVRTVKNNAFGYIFTMPERFVGKVSIKPLENSSIWQFVEYSESLKASNKVIFEIGAFEREKWDLIKNESDFEVIIEKGRYVYCLKINELYEGIGLKMNREEIKYNLLILNH